MFFVNNLFRGGGSVEAADAVEPPAGPESPGNTLDSPARMRGSSANAARKAVQANLARARRQSRQSRVDSGVSPTRRPSASPSPKRPPASPSPGSSPVGARISSPVGGRMSSGSATSGYAMSALALGYPMAPMTSGGYSGGYAMPPPMTSGYAMPDTRLREFSRLCELSTAFQVTYTR